MSKIIIIGAGAMGSAFALPCLDNKHDVNIVGTHLENNFIDSLKAKENFHPVLNAKLDKKIKIHKFDNFNNLLNNTKFFLIIFMIIGKIELISILILFKKLLFKE